jgi:hypothetical protein
MNCYVCADRGRTTAAVALCRNCSAALCVEHLAETARDLGKRLYADCRHDTWQVREPT